MSNIDLLLGGLFIVLLGVPSLLISLELLLGQKRLKKIPTNDSPKKSCTILMPAHNEELVIENTLLQLKQEVSADDRIVVIADNCTDKTVSICESLNVEVIERQSIDKRGKGFALDFGIQHISKQMPTTVVILDADSEFEEGGLTRLVSRSQTYNTVVQSMYLMRSSAGAPIKTRVAEFAWLVKNRIRPTGLARLGLGCHLQGSGMAFPAAVFDQVSLASGSIVEDLELGLKLTALGYKIAFEPYAVVNSSFPTSTDGTESQRTRWEHGHLASIAMLPKMVFSALKKRQFNVIGLCLDAAIPPTIMWLILVILASLFSGVLTLLNVNIPFYIALTCLSGILIGLFLSWLYHGLTLIKVSDFWGILKFVGSKFSIYKTFFTARQKEWVRTDRTKENVDANRDKHDKKDGL
jgi:cellulose synthase/poly-beta-1,6-N-acetylglucosamine synthase-like glycosyltransferase